MIQYDILYIDYQDKNCVLMNNSTVPITRHPPTTPYGGVIADLGTGNSGQPFKFGGKELISANGLNEYDFGARRYYQAVPHFTGIDPMCEKYYWLSPYLYCANNPVNLVDKDGQDIWELDELGNILNSHPFDQFDNIIVRNNNGNIKKSWVEKYGSIKNQSSSIYSSETPYIWFESAESEVSKSLFEFLAENTTVEWSRIEVKTDNENSLNYISTSHNSKSEAGGTDIINSKLNNSFILECDHSHPNDIRLPSGLLWHPKNKGDIQFADWVNSLNKGTATFKIYLPGKKEYIEYNAYSTYADFMNK